MRHSILLLSSLAGCTMLTSCFKDEPLNAECDIEQAYVQIDDPLTIFTQADLASKNVASNETNVIFTIKPDADVSNIPVSFKITPGATISPESGTPLDFSGEMPQHYTVTSEDRNWTRDYTVTFRVNDLYELPTHFGFENHEIYDGDGVKDYYVWYDINKFEKRVDTWATGNSGYRMSKLNESHDLFPSVPVNDGNGPENGIHGEYVKLTTCDTGPFGKYSNPKMLIAAGNLFIGKFYTDIALKKPMIATEFGLPFNKIPKRLKGWYKYTPGSKFQDKDGKPVSGRVDQGDIYAVLYRNHSDEGKAFVLNGNDVKTNKYIVAIAELGTINNTPDWTHFDIEFKYKDGFDLSDPEFLKELRNQNGYSLTIVCTSSIEGAKFEGAVGSTLCIDEFELECE